MVVAEFGDPASVAIRPAVPGDAEGITRAFLDSAQYHAHLDERYGVPPAGAVSERYREGRQHAAEDAERSITLVAELGGEIVGFVDVRLEQSPDPMHREITYCHVVEIAVGGDRQRQGIGARLLQAAEDWGRSRGATFALLEYLANNRTAAAFYERMDYRVVSQTAIKRL